MGGYEISIPAYQGPIEVLLSLINKHKIDIYDIPVAELTDEFLLYISENSMDLDMATEFLEMASTLLEVKSKMLLFHKSDPEISEDPREKLVEQLLEYKKIKMAAGELKKLDFINSKIFCKEPEDFSEVLKISVNPQKLPQALNRLILKTENKKPAEKPLFRETYTVEDAISDLMSFTNEKKEFGFSEIPNVFCSPPKFFTLFMALLELVRQNRIKAMQSVPYGEIVVRDVSEENGT